MPKYLVTETINSAWFSAEKGNTIELSSVKAGLVNEIHKGALAPVTGASAEEPPGAEHSMKTKDTVVPRQMGVPKA